MEASELAAKLRQAQQLIQDCLDSLGDLNGTLKAAVKTTIPAEPTDDLPDFGVPIRPFMKSFADLSGAKKFTLLVAWLAKGDLAAEVTLGSVASEWNTMSGMLKAKFNRKFSSDAREADWVATTKEGVYVLRPNWTQILDNSR
jgi:hypothetical protein